MRYRASCHCGDVAFEFDGEVTAAVACNCSICARKGALLWATPRQSLTLLTPDENAGAYLFNNHKIAHRFCRRCGMQPYAEDAGDGEERSAYVNLRCVDDFDPATVEIIPFDGRSM